MDLIGAQPDRAVRRFRLPRLDAMRAARSACSHSTVRDHLLLAPDHLDALVLTVDLMRQLTAPRDILIVLTGADVSVPATGTALVTQPDASVRTVSA